MTNLSPELRQAIERAGNELVRLEDAQTRQTYVLLKAEVYRLFVIEPQGQEPDEVDYPSAWR